MTTTDKNAETPINATSVSEGGINEDAKAIASENNKI